MKRASAFGLIQPSFASRCLVAGRDLNEPAQRADVGSLRLWSSFMSTRPSLMRTRAAQHVTCISAILRFVDRLNDRIASWVG